MGQFTTDGDISGYINLGGQDVNGNTWEETQIYFSSNLTTIYGCTNPGACGYNPDATIDDGSCSYCAEYCDECGVCETILFWMH